jgi:hypothetical protein
LGNPLNLSAMARSWTIGSVLSGALASRILGKGDVISLVRRFRNFEEIERTCLKKIKNELLRIFYKLSKRNGFVVIAN